MNDLMTQLRLELSNRQIHWWDNSNDVFDRTRCIVNKNLWTAVIKKDSDKLELWDFSTIDDEDNPGPITRLSIEETLVILFGEEYV